MNLTDKLDGIKISATFSVKKDEDASAITQCQVEYDFSGIELKDVLNRWAKKSLVIETQRVMRNLTEKEVKETCVDTVYKVHALNAGKKVESPAARKAAAQATLKAMSDEELKGMGLDEESIKNIRKN